MQLFIGGACAGKRSLVKTRFPSAVWWRLAPGQRLRECAGVMLPSTPLILHGVLEWLSASMDSDAGSDGWRSQWCDDLNELLQSAKAQQTALVIIASDIGRGIVPIERHQRRLRDLNGWFSQDVAERAEHVWYVRHGLVQGLPNK
ncbi:bifunctional adenosylcobinamide kinase/adenosylcobinamide-phosphate guanylyltransferase [Halomonas citrativorans]|uniref:Adenosylcobinamide kinase n=2 Tax=Halomonadaceae TaxID=28256 RepID=A0ABR9FC67_9GAMM|nr:bifunctional adenosylcobinamide kinase/adenosylcobinamide-phosphate guanylyltransferase [Halomonas citrativorans]MBE0403991.1 bifunctional adenosylcobinamide kinase/adenosylcobinamide-phosphate guanylyltransferase [Halomonas citrativorans]